VNKAAKQLKLTDFFLTDIIACFHHSKLAACALRQHCVICTANKEYVIAFKRALLHRQLQVIKTR
jgi:hypothetical protein